MSLKTLTFSALFVSLTPAIASHATFDFTEADPDSPPHVFVVDDIELTVDSGTFDTVSGLIDFKARDAILNRAYGLGISALDDIDLIDGENGDDLVVFSFGSVVVVDQVELADADGQDRVVFGPVRDGVFEPFDTAFVGEDTVDIDALFGEVEGDRFAIGATGDGDAFGVASLSVSKPRTGGQSGGASGGPTGASSGPSVAQTAFPVSSRSAGAQPTDPQSLPPVPLPASGLLLLGCLGGLVATRRKRA